MKKMRNWSKFTLLLLLLSTHWYWFYFLMCRLTVDELNEKTSRGKEYESNLEKELENALGMVT